MRVLIAGWQSQVAQEFMALAARSTEITSCSISRPGFELCALPTIQRQFRDLRPDVIVNASAYRGVDAAQQDQDNALALNLTGARHLARAAAQDEIPIIHISNFHVFSGDKNTRYHPNDDCAPRTFYGQTRLQGEDAIREENPRHVIVRTGWLLGTRGANFLRTVARKTHDAIDHAASDAAQRSAANAEAIRLVTDHRGTPTMAGELARALPAVMTRMAGDDAPTAAGTYHFASPDEATWADIGAAVVEQLCTGMDVSPGVAPPIDLVRHEDVAPDRPRPANSCLDSTLFNHTFGTCHAPWREALQACVADLLSELPTPSRTHGQRPVAGT